MTTKRRSITFYAEPDIADWYESIPEGMGARVINQTLRDGISHKLPDFITQGKLPITPSGNPALPLVSSARNAELANLESVLQKLTDRVSQLEKFRARGYFCDLHVHPEATKERVRTGVMEHCQECGAMARFKV